MFNANGGNEGSYTGLNTALTAAGGDSSKLEDDYHWSSSESVRDRAYRLSLLDGDAYWSFDYKVSDFRVRACLAF